VSDFIVINGDEEFLKERAAFKIAESGLFDEVFKFYFPSDLNRYLNLSQCESFDKKTCYIVYNSTSVPDLPIDENNALILIVSENHKLKDERANQILNFPKLKTFDNNNEVINFIIDEGKFYQIDLTRVAHALFVSCGNCLRKLSSEIEKIAIISSPGSVVTSKEIQGVVCFSAELSPKQIIDCMTLGKLAPALAFYDKLQESVDETGWIVAYMQRHVLRQLQLEEVVNSNINDLDAAKILEMHPTRYINHVKHLTNVWSKTSLLSSLEKLCDIDIAHKRGKIVAKLDLQLEIIRLSQEAKRVSI